MAKARMFQRLSGFSPLLLVMSCASSGPPPSALLAPAAETRALTYWCGDGGSLSVEMLADGVRLLGADADGVDLPSVPQGQRKRYSREPYSLVLDGKDVLFVKRGNPPLACTR